MANMEELARIFSHPVTQAFLLAVVSGIGMLFVAMGLLFLFENFIHYAILVLPFPLPFLALLFAVIFVVTAAILEMRGAGHVRALWGGAFLGAIFTVLAMLVYGGFIYLLSVGGPYYCAPNLEELLAAAAICIVASAVMTRFLPD